MPKTDAKEDGIDNAATITYLKVKAQAGKNVGKVFIQVGVGVICRNEFHVAVGTEAIDGMRHHQATGQGRRESRHDRLCDRRMGQNWCEIKSGGAHE